MSGAVSGRQLCRDLIRHINSNDDAELLSSDVKFFLSFISTSDEEVHEELIIDEVLPAVHRSLARALHARSYEIVKLAVMALWSLCSLPDNEAEVIQGGSMEWLVYTLTHGSLPELSHELDLQILCISAMGAMCCSNYGQDRAVVAHAPAAVAGDLGAYVKQTLRKPVSKKKKGKKASGQRQARSLKYERAIGNLVLNLSEDHKPNQQMLVEMDFHQYLLAFFEDGSAPPISENDIELSDVHKMTLEALALIVTPATITDAMLDADALRLLVHAVQMNAADASVAVASLTLLGVICRPSSKLTMSREQQLNNLRQAGVTKCVDIMMQEHPANADIFTAVSRLLCAVNVNGSSESSCRQEQSWRR
eukprot:TRINITY_DN11482_c0_g1_i23.p1 TRINITY_DN11482_c0_g1~~TRINITY_DN11482_c0_g1_i23.p1  ORF type:complete len:364 (+),score=33.60 TRINITY_DN11482_c0_g1_i23:125-1216(+)